MLVAQAKDSLQTKLPADSIQASDSTRVSDSAKLVRIRQVNYDSAVALFLRENRFIKTAARGTVQLMSPKKNNNRDYLFYILAGMALMLGCLKFFYARYFTTLFRVFFNSSLRQGQLTDQLLQAKLPSLLFNIFFVLAGGFFIYLLLIQYNWATNPAPWWLFLPLSVAAVAIIYSIKYFTLKFTGWITSYKDPADTYIFIIFLVNKIIGILLVPVLVLMAFSEWKISRAAMFTALFVIGILLIFRFFRSYGLLQGRLKVSRTHFFLYIIGIEVLPILMICKGLMIYLNKSL